MAKAGGGAGGFGGRNDMISSKFNEVQRDYIRKEMLKRENSLIKISENFNINPKKMSENTYTSKPSQVDPYKLQHLLRTTNAEDDTSDPEMKEKIARANMMPQERDKYPRTSNDVVGWFYKKGAEQRKKDLKWFQNLNRCDEVKYAESYIMMAGKSPYANSGPKK
uniref:Uncharacterized protein n=1 Tax=uncultured gamma proteobacterium HF0010_26J14 TaxID=723564 RepID=E7C1U6_9GAMM|nr:hypothetical protein [uncultured gamma proteobacterium HF0010_26J14]